MMDLSPPYCLRVYLTAGELETEMVVSSPGGTPMIDVSAMDDVEGRWPAKRVTFARPGDERKRVRVAA